MAPGRLYSRRMLLLLRAPRQGSMRRSSSTRTLCSWYSPCVVCSCTRRPGWWHLTACRWHVDVLLLS